MTAILRILTHCVRPLPSQRAQRVGWFGARADRSTHGPAGCEPVEITGPPFPAVRGQSPMRRAFVVTALAATLTALAPATAGRAAATDPSPSGSAPSGSTATPGDQLTGLGTLGDFGTPT